MSRFCKPRLNGTSEISFDNSVAIYAAAYGKVHVVILDLHAKPLYFFGFVSPTIS